MAAFPPKRIRTALAKGAPERVCSSAQRRYKVPCTARCFASLSPFRLSSPRSPAPLSRSRGLFVVSVSLEGKVYCVRVRRCAVRGSPSALLRARAGVLVLVAVVVVVVARALARSWHMCLARLWLRRTRLCLCLRVCRACVVASLVLVAM